MPILEDSVKMAQEAGLTGYQARAYVALLRMQRAKVLPLARASGVPRNKLYRVLEDLEAMGLVRRSNPDPLEYEARPLAPFVQARLEKLQALLSQLEGGDFLASKGGGEGDPYLTRSANARHDAG